MKPKNYITLRYQLIDYNCYEDEDGNRWYVPTDEMPCPTCLGTGKFWVGDDDMDDDGYIDCPECDGECYLETEYLDLMLSEEDYQSVTRQEKWLMHRYGRIPSRIDDYWMRP